MSGLRGDKARFHRLRKQKLLRRKKALEVKKEALLKTAEHQTA